MSSCTLADFCLVISLSPTKPSGLQWKATLKKGEGSHYPSKREVPIITYSLGVTLGNCLNQVNNLICKRKNKEVSPGVLECNKILGIQGWNLAP